MLRDHHAVLLLESKLQREDNAGDAESAESHGGFLDAATRERLTVEVFPS